MKIFGKKEKINLNEEADKQINEMVYRLKTDGRQIDRSSEQFRAKIKEADRQAEHNWNIGNNHQFKRYIATMGKAQKHLNFNEMLSAEIGGTIDVLELLKNSNVVKNVGKDLEGIHKLIGLETAEFDKAIESLQQIKESTLKRIDNLVISVNNDSLLNDYELDELCKQKETEYALRRETKQQEIQLEENKLNRIKSLD